MDVMQPYYARDGITVFHGDCREIVPQLDIQFSAVCTDPPYGLSFMGKGWDHAVPGVEFWQVFRDGMTPGAHLLAFGGTRLWHRLAVAVEDAGFEIKDTLMWLHGQGFPKHKSLLKPAWEPVLLARKPGPGVLQIDACRIPAQGRPHIENAARVTPHGIYNNGKHGSRNAGTTNQGRWPANVLLDEAAAEQLDAQSGNLAAGNHPRVRNTSGYSGGLQQGITGHDGRRMEGGGASRFFYVAKASRAERNAGLDGLPEQKRNAEDYRRRINTSKKSDGGIRGDIPRANHHPTVKPLALMEWLVTLVTPPGGTVLDPFAGSGTTGVACARLGIPCVLVEQEAEYLPIIAGRIDHAIDAKDAEGAQPRQLSIADQEADCA